MRAEAFVGNGFSCVLLPAFLSTNTKRDWSTLLSWPFLRSVSRMMAASFGAITEAASLPNHAAYCLLTASRKSN